MELHLYIVALALAAVGLLVAAIILVLQARHRVRALQRDTQPTVDGGLFGTTKATHDPISVRSSVILEPEVLHIKSCSFTRQANAPHSAPDPALPPFIYTPPARLPSFSPPLPFEKPTGLLNADLPNECTPKSIPSDWFPPQPDDLSFTDLVRESSPQK